MRKTLALKLAAACAAVLTVTACGGGRGGSDRPSTDSIAKALSGGDSVLGSQAGSLDKSVTDCMAKVLHDSKLSDKTLEALVKGDQDYEGTDAEKKTLQDLTPRITECAAKQSK